LKIKEIKVTKNNPIIEKLDS